MGSSRSARLHRRGVRGQGTAEFVLVAPLLIGLAFGIFDFGRALSANITVTNASKEAARYLAAYASSNTGTGFGASSCWTTSGGTTTAPASGSAQSKAWNQLAAANVDLTQVKEIDVYYYTSDPVNDTSSTHSGASYYAKCSSATNSSTPSTGGTYTPSTGDWVVVEVKYTFVPTTPLVHLIVSSVTLDQTTTMVLE